MGEELEITRGDSTEIKRHGGARPRAGRPPNEVKYKTKISKATDIMGRMLPEAAQATVDLATGAYVLLVFNSKKAAWEKPANMRVAQAAVDMGHFRVYQELPSMRAVEVMFERLMGKVPQPVDITVRQAVSEVTEAQAILLRVIEEHVPSEYLTPIREELERVAQHHSNARTAVGIE